MDINELMKVNSWKILDELEEMMLEEALNTSFNALDIDDDELLSGLFTDRFEKSKPELAAIITKVLADTLIQLQKDTIWTS